MESFADGSHEGAEEKKRRKREEKEQTEEEGKGKMKCSSHVGTSSKRRLRPSANPDWRKRLLHADASGPTGVLSIGMCL
jgi:hypothetical protein